MVMALEPDPLKLRWKRYDIASLVRHPRARSKGLDSITIDSSVRLLRFNAAFNVGVTIQMFQGSFNLNR